MDEAGNGVPAAGDRSGDAIPEAEGVQIGVCDAAPGFVGNGDDDDADGTADDGCLGSGLPAVGAPEGFGLSDGSRLLRRPDHKAFLEILLPFPGRRLSTTMSAIYVGKRDDLDPATFNTVKADDYLTVDLAGSFQLTESLQIFGRIHNIFDQAYEDVLGFSTAGLSAYGG